MSNELLYRWDFLPEREEELPLLAKSTLPGPRTLWEQAEATEKLDAGLREFERTGVLPRLTPPAVDPQFVDALEKAADDLVDDHEEKGWLAKLFSKARQA